MIPPIQSLLSFAEHQELADELSKLGQRFRLDSIGFVMVRGAESEICVSVVHPRDPRSFLGILPGIVTSFVNDVKRQESTFTIPS